MFLSTATKISAYRIRFFVAPSDFDGEERPFLMRNAYFCGDMEFRTIVETAHNESVRLDAETRVVLVGSCFAEEIGQRLVAALPDERAAVNPRGVLYNPASIRYALRRLMNEEADEATYCFEAADGLWRHWMAAGEFAGTTREECCKRIAEAEERARSVFRQAALVVVTLSNDRVYRLREGEHRGEVVANCHKMPGTLFDELPLDMAEEEKAWDELLTTLSERQPQTKVLFTLSPYRYRKYGFHESRLGKARLLCLIDRLMQRHPQTAHYFPAYEIVEDELRDYRFYAADMLHPSAQAVDYVWERFRQWSFTPELEAYAAEKQALLRDMKHRPLHPESPEALRFADHLRQKTETFKQKWGHAPAQPSQQT